MFKTNEEIIVIQAEAKDPIPTKVVFWSHDKGTAKMIFQLQKDYVNQTLSEGTIVPICLDFVGGRHIYHAVIEDAVNGIVSIVLEDNILGYVGRVTGSIYIELPDSRSLDTAGRFTFDIKRSPIDLNTPELEDYYWQGFNEIMNQYHQTIAEIETESERLLNELQARILTLEEKLAGVELRARFKTAWSWSADGTDRFTTVYPRENLVNIRTTNLTSTNIATVPIRNEMLTENGISFVRAIRTNPTLNPTVFSIYTSFLLDRELDKDISGKKVELSFMARASRPTKFTMMAVLAKPDVNLSENGKAFDISTEWKQYGFVQDNFPSYTTDTLLRINPGQTIGLNNVDGFYLDYRDVKISIIDDDNDTITIYTTPPSDDPINAYPTYKGISIADSDNPADYSWQAEDNTIAKKATLDSHTENINNPHKVTKTQIGLGNVDNYSTATQAEAEAGTATNKFMTPVLVFKAIAKWVQGKFVSTTGNETILGTKNFQDGVQVKGNLPVLTKSVNDYASVDKNNNASVISNGSMRLSRRGDIVYLTGSFQLSAAINNQAVWFDVPAWAAPIDMPRMYWSSGGNFYLLTFDPITINNIICTGNVAKDAWLSGSFCWLARDPY